MDRVGVFLCSGCGIGEAVDLAAVARQTGATTTLTHPCLCGDEGVGAIRAAAAAGAVNGILVAACSSRAKSRVFAPLETDTTALCRVSLREQVAWSHPAGTEDTRLLAEDLVRMGVARLARSKPLQPLAEAVADTVLVVGGGRAGLEAALAASALGHPVVLVETEARLGGHLAAQVSVLPERPPYDAPQANPIAGLVREVSCSRSIRVCTSCTIRRITGQPGQLDVSLVFPARQETVRVGAIVQATGARPYDASKLGHLGYGASPDVLTTHELEAMLAAGKLECPSTRRTPQRVVFVQCAGSRDPQHLVYCSSECCGQTLRQVAEIHALEPGVESAVIYRDMRTPAMLEHFYLGVQAAARPLMTRGEVERVSCDGGLRVHLRDSLLGPQATLAADLVVLAVGMVPTAADGEAIRTLHDALVRAETGDSETQRREARETADRLARHQGTEILNLDYRQGPDLPVLRHGFPDSHYICFPYETRRTGIYAAGTVRAPMDPAQAAEDGWGAAMKAVQCIEAARRGEAVHPRAGDRTVPELFLQRCTQCKRCTEECPFATFDEDAQGTPVLRPFRCRRCGICLGSCPERIVSFPDFSVDMVAAMIKAVGVPEEEGKPRILALLCENDALPALDAAGARRHHWNPWVRVIPVRCLGSFNVVWVADALSKGIDGVILVGCTSGDDSQCHFLRGSELAATRLANVGETLQRLALEPERVRTVELAHDEVERIPQILDDFASELERLGPSPFKGF